MISIELSVKHMAWANQEIFKEVKKLGPEVLDYYVVDPEWTVKTIMVHIVGASYLYGKRLQQKELSRIEFDIESPDLIDNLLSELEIIDKNLIEQAYKDDIEVTYETSKGDQSDKISTILSMMIFHATEHRAQIVAALDKNNERSINLDEFSILRYVRQNT
tara:strand:+ start:322 stop:804 length:483 start_codon:yes stop_codon:yes gene_type:complete